VTATASTNTLVIAENANQPWAQGKIQADPLQFQVYVKPVDIGNSEEHVLHAHDTTQAATASIVNSKMAADLELFGLKERGDTYYLRGWPYNWDVSTLVDPNDTTGYDIIDIEYEWHGDTEDVQKSKKSITLICAPAAVGNLILALNAWGAANTPYENYWLINLT